MPIIKFVNESEKIEYPTEQDVCSLLCYAFAPQKTIMNDNQFVGCKPFGFPFWYMRNPLAVHQFMEFNHKRQFKHRKDLAKHRVISFSKEENKAPGDSECVNAYLDFLLMLAEKLPRTDERKSFADQANLVLSFYEENADLTDDIINNIHVYHNRLGAVVTDIAQLEQEEYEKQKRAIEATNTTQIKKLYTIKQKLENAKTHAEFDKLLQEISAVDAEIDHDNLTSEQKTHYDQLNKSCTDTISAKMRQLEYKDNIDYNKKAVNAYNSAFTSFKNNESRYKDKSQLLGLVSTTLFAYDAGRLFNETLIFYNHVYSYIFNKLDDNGKLELTKYSIECERKQG